MAVERIDPVMFPYLDSLKIEIRTLTCMAVAYGFSNLIMKTINHKYLYNNH